MNRGEAGRILHIHPFHYWNQRILAPCLLRPRLVRYDQSIWHQHLDLRILLCLPAKCKLEVAVQVSNTQHGVSRRKGILETPLHLNTNPGMTNNMVHLNMSNWWNGMADSPRDSWRRCWLKQNIQLWCFSMLIIGPKCSVNPLIQYTGFWNRLRVRCICVMHDDFCHILLLDLPGVSIRHRTVTGCQARRFSGGRSTSSNSPGLLKRDNPSNTQSLKGLSSGKPLSMQLSHPQGGLSGGGNPCILNADILSYSPSEDPFVGVSWALMVARHLSHWSFPSS